MSRYTPSQLQADRQPVECDLGGWLHDLALSYKETGDALIARGHFATAVEEYQASLSLFDRLAANDLRAQVDLADARTSIADAHAIAAKAQVRKVSAARKVGWLQTAIQTLRSARSRRREAIS